jgi:beta-glucanase (GH16 family)
MSALVAAELTTLSAATPWVLVWTDEFDGPANSAINTRDWQYDVGTQYSGGPAQWGTGEVEAMSSSLANVSLDGSGHLAITPLHTGNVPTAGWTSGRIETTGVFEAPAGGALAIEASLWQPGVSGPSAAGYWPALWALGAPFRGNFQNWPRVGELDIMEDVNGLSAEFATLHCGTSPGGPCDEFNGLTSHQLPCTGCQAGFHVYRLEQDRSSSPEQIRWYLDGALIFTVNATSVDSGTWADATHHGFFVLLDLAIGGGFPAAFGGGPTASTMPGVPLLVDYVRVFVRPSGFTDDPIVPGQTAVRAIHVLELRARIDAARTAHGLAPYAAWSDGTLNGVVIRAVHVIELRDALGEVYAVAALQQPAYTDSPLSIGTTVKALHISELRTALLSIE